MIENINMIIDNKYFISGEKTMNLLIRTLPKYTINVPTRHPTFVFK